jgi:mono/diheme cytochrome c family protein
MKGVGHECRATMSSCGTLEGVRLHLDGVRGRWDLPAFHIQSSGLLRQTTINQTKGAFMKTLPYLLVLLMLVALSGCSGGVQSGRGFRLPDGDVDQGRQAFLDLKCNSCHEVAGEALPPPSSFNLRLGGETIHVRTYGELVTSVINPSHVVKDQYREALTEAQLSPMPEFNHVMTVEQMIDLVAFLQPQYHLVERTYDPTRYP